MKRSKHLQQPRYFLQAWLAKLVQELGAQRATDLESHLHLRFFPRTSPDLWPLSREFRDPLLEKEYLAAFNRSLYLKMPTRLAICAVAICTRVLFRGLTWGMWEDPMLFLLPVNIIIISLLYTERVTPISARAGLVLLTLASATYHLTLEIRPRLGVIDKVIFSDVGAQTSIDSVCNGLVAYTASVNDGSTMCHGRSTRMQFARYLRLILWVNLRSIHFLKFVAMVFYMDFSLVGLPVRISLVFFLMYLVFILVYAALPWQEPIFSSFNHLVGGMPTLLAFIIIHILTIAGFLFIRQRQYQRRAVFFSDFLNNVQRRRKIDIEKLQVQRMELRKEEYQKQIARHMNDGQWVQVPRNNTGGILVPREASAYSEEAAVSKYQYWKIPFDDITISQNRLGVGSFGMVHHGSYRGQDVAVKQMLEATQESIPFFVTELNILSQLTHPNIVKLIGANWEGPQIFLALAYHARRDLETCLNAEKTLKWSVKTGMLLDIARGMAFMHSKCICHRDLKPTNVLVHQNYSCCMCDFESSCNFGDETDDHTILVGTPVYIAPEMLEAHENRNVSLPQSDVYSFGILCIAVAISPYLILNQFMVRALGSTTNSSVRKIDRVTDALSAGWRPDLKFGATPDAQSFIRKWVRRQNPATLNSDQFDAKTICATIQSNLSGELVKMVVACWNKEPGERTSFARITAEWKLHEKDSGEHKPTSADDEASDDVVVDDANRSNEVDSGKQVDGSSSSGDSGGVTAAVTVTEGSPDEVGTPPQQPLGDANG